MADTPQARRRPLAVTGPPAVTGPLAGWPGRLAELLHVRWLLDFGASEPVLGEQRRGLPAIWRAAAHLRPAAGSASS